MAPQVYDYVLTFLDEQRLVWPSKRSHVKVAFYLNRYIPLLAGVISIYGVYHVCDQEQF